MINIDADPFLVHPSRVWFRVILLKSVRGMPMERQQDTYNKVGRVFLSGFDRLVPSVIRPQLVTEER